MWSPTTDLTEESPFARAGEGEIGLSLFYVAFFLSCAEEIIGGGNGESSKEEKSEVGMEKETEAERISEGGWGA